MPDYSKTKIQFRRGTAAEFASSNPTLGVGEPAFASDTNTLKIGDGSTAYSSLSSISGGGGGSSTFVGLSDTPANFTSAGSKFVKVNSGASAVEFVSLSPVQSDATGISGATAVTNIVYMSQTDYNALGSYDSSTIYYIVQGYTNMPDYIGSDDIVKKYIGDQEVLKAYVGSTEIYAASTTAPPASLTIAKISDGSSSYAVEVVFSLTTLPAGTTQLKYTISGTGSTSTVVTIPTSTASNTIHNGTGGSSSFRSRYNSSTNRGSFYHGPGDDVTNISLTVEALNSSSTTLGTSNTLTGLVIDEDG